ncbi:MAG: response regulator transcription factor [Deltaproteobacteria bacterium]|nr:response regulator transcription factor [Deltaproteobacteria bacterium]MCW5807882.1 response regulator transcription factor [Deltaproteobacteria bacterium]
MDAERRLLIVEDHALVRDGLRLLLERIGPAWQILDAGTIAAAERVLASVAVELVVLDHFLPDGEGIGALTRLHAASPSTKVVIVSAADDGPTVRAAIEAGASGYVPKSYSGDLMLNALRSVLAGGTYIPREAIVPSTAAPTPLTGRQREVLGMVVQGLVNQEIADTLGASESTVRAHLTAIYRQLGVRNRAQAVQVAMQKRLV